MDTRLYFRQLLCGRDIASTDGVAAQMANQVYVIGDRASREAVIVDPAWAVGDVLDLLAADGMRLVGVLVTHHHPDHVGGTMMGHRIEGLADVLEQVDVPVHAHRLEAPWVARTAGLGDTAVRAHEDGDTVLVGGVPVQLLHTPGHTPGSQCFLVDRCLVAGDTLFLEGCGRTDLPGSDPEAMFLSLARLATLPDETIVYPGHRYSMASVGTIAAVKEVNAVLKPATKQAWLMRFGGA